MKLVIEFDLDGDMDTLANFHAMAREFFTVLSELIPDSEDKSFRALVDSHGTGQHGEITLLEVKPVDDEGDDVQARAMIIDTPMNKTMLSKREQSSVERRKVSLVG